MNKLCCKFILLILLSSMSFISAANHFKFYAIDVIPVGYKSGNEVKGYTVDILKRIREELDIKDSKIHLGPYPRLLKALNGNKSGLVITCLFPSPKFNEKVTQTSNVGHFDIGIVSLKDNLLNWDNIAGKKVAALKGASKVFGNKFHSKVEDNTIKLIEVTDYTQAMKMLKAKRIDGFAGNLPPMLNYIHKLSIDIAEPLIINRKTTAITISVAPGTPNAQEKIAKITAIIDQMKASGEIQDIIESYLPEAIQPR